MDEREQAIVNTEIAMTQLNLAVQNAREQLARLKGEALPAVTEQELAALRPAAEAIDGIAQWVASQDEAAARTLLDICVRATPTNCPWQFYRAAQIISDDLKLRFFAAAVPPPAPPRNPTPSRGGSGSPKVS